MNTKKLVVSLGLLVAGFAHAEGGSQSGINTKAPKKSWCQSVRDAGRCGWNGLTGATLSAPIAMLTVAKGGIAFKRDGISGAKDVLSTKQALAGGGELVLSLINKLIPENYEKTRVSVLTSKSALELCTGVCSARYGKDSKPAIAASVALTNNAANMPASYKKTVLMTRTTAGLNGLGAALNSHFRTGECKVTTAAAGAAGAYGFAANSYAADKN